MLAAVFLIFAFVQVNDPDPVLWILIYGLMAVACVLAAFGRHYRIASLALLVLYAGYSIVYLSGVAEWLRSDDKAMLFDDVAKMQFRYIEESREFLGLMICIAVLIMHLLSGRNAKIRG